MPKIVSRQNLLFAAMVVLVIALAILAPKVPTRTTEGAGQLPPVLETTYGD